MKQAPVFWPVVSLLYAAPELYNLSAWPQDSRTSDQKSIKVKGPFSFCTRGGVTLLQPALWDSAERS